MKIKRIVAGIIIGLCISLALFTLKSDRRPPASPAPRHAVNMPSHLPDVDPPAADPWLPASTQTKKAVASSIVAQLNAFKKNDYVKAGAYQSSSFRQRKMSSQQFQSMIRTAYPEFANYRSVEFGLITSAENSRFVMAQVRVTGVDGKAATAVYVMVFEDGIYRVDGVEGGISPRAVAVHLKTVYT